MDKFPNTSDLDQAAAAFRDLAPAYAALYRGLRSEGLGRYEAALVTGSYFAHSGMMGDDTDSDSAE